MFAAICAAVVAVTFLVCAVALAVDSRQRATYHAARMCRN